MQEKSPVVKTVKKILPAVVSITCSKYMEGVPSPDLFNTPKKKVKVGGGSGFIVDKSGIIFTNRHVIDDPKGEYFVVLQNGEKLRPKVLAKDYINDIAVLKINKDNLPIVQLGDSSNIDLGQEVVAIGNALGMFKNTVSTGIVSGLSRMIMAQNNANQQKTKLKGLIQTDAAINPGNSGGPLVDLNGKAIGINAAMVFGAENIGFALPINNAKKDLQDVKEYGRIREPYIGIRYVSIDQELKDKFDLPVPYGALVISEPDINNTMNAVIPGSPAYKAGVKESDIILEVDSTKITPENTVTDILQKCEIGQRLSLKLLRKGRKRSLKIILAEKK